MREPVVMTKRERAAEARRKKREQKQIAKWQKYFNLPYGLWWMTDDGKLISRI